MLAKLLKYDLKYIYKVLGVYYLITVILAIIFLLTDFENSDGIVNFIHVFSGGLCFGLSIGLAVNVITRGWVRFQKNFYGEESYLTHTLPVAKNQLLLSKTIASLITLFVSLVLITFCLVVTQLLSEIDFTEIDVALKSRGYSLFGFGMLLFITVLVQYFFVIECGFTGILLGHRKNEHRAVWSWLFGGIIYLAVNLIAVGLLALWAHFDSNIHAFLFSGSSQDIFNLANIQQVILGINVIYTAAAITLYFVELKTLKRGVDVE